MTKERKRERGGREGEREDGGRESVRQRGANRTPDRGWQALGLQLAWSIETGHPGGSGQGSCKRWSCPMRNRFMEMT